MIQSIPSSRPVCQFSRLEAPVGPTICTWVNRQCMDSCLFQNYKCEVECKYPCHDLIVSFDSCFVLRRINPFRVIWCWIKFRTVKIGLSIVFVYKQLNVKTVQLNVKTVQLNVKTVQFQTINFSISTQLSSI